MDNQLLTVIHKYAEDREIDWTSAKVIGEQYGKVFKSEDDLREWKYTIDNYLKTFSPDAFRKVEEACKKIDEGSMADTLVKKGLAKNKKQADEMCKRYQDPKTGKVDVKKLENDIEKLKRGRKLESRNNLGSIMMEDGNREKLKSRVKKAIIDEIDYLLEYTGKDNVYEKLETNNNSALLTEVYEEVQQEIYKALKR